MKPIWKFPSAGGGNISGLNDNGITQFKAVPITSVTKETLQDSLDARASDTLPAIVTFKKSMIPKDLIPDVNGLQNIFKLGKQYWTGHNQSEAEEFFDNGLKCLEQDEIPVLAIQDYNTKGLSNIGGENGKNTGGWIALVRSTGITEKGPQSSGSFGIGKHAPFAISAVQTVLYGTVNEENKFGFQGVCKIASFLDEQEDLTQGTGYYGFAEEKDFKPITNINNVPKPFARTDQGTDKFILGFEEPANWTFEVLKEVVSSYMLAIIDGKLEVHIEEEIVNKDTLPTLISEIQKREPDNRLLEFYDALTNENSKRIVKSFLTDQGTEEEIVLHLLANPGYKKRIVLYRGTGMKIYDRGHFRTPAEFAGVLIVKGERLNAILRKMEPPTHDKWDPNLYKINIPYAKKLHKEINQWMNEETRNLIDLTNVESVELKGIEHILPDVTDKESAVIKINKQSMKPKTKSIKKKKQPIKDYPTGIPANDGDPGKQSPKKGDIDPISTPGSSDTNTPEEQKVPKARIKRIRSFCIDATQGKYILIFWSQSFGERIFSISTIGENNKANKVDIVHAKDRKTGEIITTTANQIGPLRFTKDEITEVEITLNAKDKFALEVRAE